MLNFKFFSSNIKKVPPPQLPNQNRFHLVNPMNNQKQLLTFSASSSASSTSSSSTTSSSSSSPTGGCTLNANNNNNTTLSESQTLNKKRNKASKKSKKYEKLLTVKSQDSAVTTTTTATSIDNSNSSSLSHMAILTRLFTNKVTLQPFIDQFIETIFTNTANLPPVVQHLFEFFDLEAKKYQQQILMNSTKDTSKNANAINDELNKLTRVWKTNSYFLRYWINLIKNPEFLLSIDSQSSPSMLTTNPAASLTPPTSSKNVLVDSSLTCIAQTLLDACSNTETHNLYDTNSPLNRLLFIREVPRYREMIETFYKEMQTYTPITDHELHYYLNEFSKCQQQQQATQQLGSTLNNSGGASATGAVLNEINSIQVLLQLYEYYEKYEKQINALLGQQQCSILLPVHHRLVQIKDLMMSQTCSQSFANQQQTMNRINHLHHTLPTHQQQQQQQQQQHLCNSNQFNPYNQYQQPINCYAATVDLNLMNQMHTLSNNSHHQNQQFTGQQFF
jgi:hypothetical protein